MSGSRTCDRLLCEEGVWVVITAIMWIARPSVAHCVVEMIMKCLNVRHVNPFPFYMSKMHYV